MCLGGVPLEAGLVGAAPRHVGVRLRHPFRGPAHGLEAGVRRVEVRLFGSELGIGLGVEFGVGRGRRRARRRVGQQTNLRLRGTDESTPDHHRNDGTAQICWGRVTWSGSRSTTRSPRTGAGPSYRSHRPPRFGIRPSASPPRCRSTVRTTPPWVTTSTSPSWAEATAPERVEHPGQHRGVGLVAVGAPPRFEEPGPPGFDLGAGAALPAAGVPLAQPHVDDRIEAEPRADELGGVAGPLQVGRVERHHAVDRRRVGRGRGLVDPDVAERRVGLPLPAPVCVPRRLAVADEEDAGHGRKVAR